MIRRCEPLKFDIALGQYHAATAHLYIAGFIIGCLNMAKDYRRSIHLFALQKLAIITAFYKTVQVTVICQGSVGSPRGGLLIDIL